jgi:hypothetical protein
MMENFPHESEGYDRQTFAIKMEIQREVMRAFCGDDKEKRLEWISVNSGALREIFARKIKEDGFFDRYKADKEKIIAEVVEEMQDIEISHA